MLNSTIGLDDLGNNKFILPSYLSHNGWTKRTLTVQEMSQVYDIPELLGNKLFGVNKETIFPFNLMCPGKVVQSLVTYMLNRWGSSLSLQMETPSKQTPKLSSFLVTLSSEEASNRNQENKYIMAYGNAAAKDDDASVPIALWNSYVFKNYFQGSSYKPSVHGKDFDALRQAMLRRYRKNVYDSSKCFITTKYGNQWYHTLHCKKNTKKRKRGISKGNIIQESLRRDVQVGRDALM